MDEILGVPLGQLTINGLALLAIGLVVVGLIKGFLVPRSFHREAVARERERAQEFKDLWDIANKRGDVMEDVASHLVVVGESVNNVLKALPPLQEGGSS